MRGRMLLLGPFLAALFAASAANAGISVVFDSDGNVLQGPQRTEYTTAGLSRYYIPKGIDLPRDLSYKYYPVFGDNFSQLVASAQENSPAAGQGEKRTPSKSEWTIGLSFDFDSTYGLDEDTNEIHVSLEIHDVIPVYTISVTLPAPIDEGSLTQVERDLWKNYFNRLADRERAHSRIIRDASLSAQVASDLKEINYLMFENREGIDIETTTNQYLRNEAIRLGREWAQKIRQKIREYDKLTEYGQKQELSPQFFSK